MKLREKVDLYIQSSTQKMLPKLPVIITISGRGFAKLTALLDKPYSEPLAKALCATLSYLVKEIDGAVFGYQYDDELIIITRNDQTNDTQPWYNNDSQKLASIAASIATLHFNDYVKANDIPIIEPTFYAKAFVVPAITDAANVLVFKQQKAMQSSVYYACKDELLKTYSIDKINKMLEDKSIEDRIAMLSSECGIDYNDYQSVFRRGAACYKKAKMVEYQGVESVKMAWTFDPELPVFAKDIDWVIELLKHQ
jgi:tRNA(His) guanylyltransferase